jgi:hypothetical protein
MQLLSCYLVIGGDDNSVVVRDHDTAVTYPEMLVLKALHGGENVRQLEDIGAVERDSDAERSRLSELYGEGIVRQTFPGHGDLPERDGKIKVRKVEKPEKAEVTADEDVFDQADPGAPKAAQRDKQTALPGALAGKK